MRLALSYICDCIWRMKVTMIVCNEAPCCVYQAAWSTELPNMFASGLWRRPVRRIRCMYAHYTHITRTHTLCTYTCTHIGQVDVYAAGACTLHAHTSSKSVGMCRCTYTHTQTSIYIHTHTLPCHTWEGIQMTTVWRLGRNGRRQLRGRPMASHFGSSNQTKGQEMRSQ